MKIIHRYLATSLLWTTALSLFVLVALFTFFSLVDQLEQTGRGNYGVLQAVTYVLLTVPRLAYELFPIAAVVGSMATLGILAQNSELVVIRTSGVSVAQLAAAMVRAGLLIVLVAVIIGEIVAPAGEEKAQYLRSVALTKQIALKTKYGFWTRDGSSYVNIRRVLPGNRVEEIYIYEFDAANRLRSSTHASRASYVDRQWLLEDLRQTIIDGVTVRNRVLDRATWESMLNPEMINFVIVEPQYLTLVGLARYISHLRQNAQSTQRYEQALWAKLVRPLTILSMIVLAVPLVRGHARFNVIGQRVFMGALIGVVFHIIDQAAGHVGVVYGIPPAISAAGPTLVLIGVLAVLLRRAN
ncbi:MAG TPA: LPS export ABC transporter permease LptG [Gammaproteobacteria bacterium]